MTRTTEERCRELETTLAILRAENEALSERAEETLLLRLVAESIAAVDDRGELLRHILERISELRALPCCACYSLDEGRAAPVSAYSSISDQPNLAARLELKEPLLSELRQGARIISNGAWEGTGLAFDFPDIDFKPHSVALMPFECRTISNGLFVFFDDHGSTDRLTPMLMLLQHIVDLTVDKLDKLSLVAELRAINTDLEQRVEERAGELSRYHDQLRTEKKERAVAEQAVRESNARFQDLFNNANDAMYLWELREDGQLGRCMEVNPAAARMTGYTRDELLQMTPQQLDDPSSSQQITEVIDKLHTDGHTTFEAVHVSKQGRPIPVEISSHVFTLNGQKVILSNTRDITDRKRADLVRQVMYNIAHAVDVTTDTAELYEAIDQEVRRLVDATNLFIGLYNKQDDTISIVFMRDQKDHFETVPAEQTISSLVIKGRESMLLREADMERLEREGRIGSVGSAAKAWLGVPLQAGDEVIGIVVVQSYGSEGAFDRSDLELLEFVSKQVAVAISRKQAEEEISKLLRSVEQSPAAMVITDLEGAIEYVNPKFEEVTGYTAEEIKGSCAGVMCPGTLSEEEHTKLWDQIRSGGEWRGEVASTRKGGELYWEWVSVSSIRSEQGEIARYLVVQEDITHRKELQEQLTQAQKMESIGTLAGGIAHDFNNLLTVINGHAEMCLLCLPRDSEAYGDVAAIQQAGRRAADLTRQLLAFSRKQMYEAKTVDLNQVIGGLDMLLSRLIGEDITIETRLRHEVPPIKADPGQLEQILMNLIVNARDAINEHNGLVAEKQIYIETDRVHVDESRAHEIAELEPGAYVLLMVSDNGAGMSDETQRKIFEPFFTTKGRDKGTGLGLSTVYGIVRQNGGGVEVESEPGMGTTFRIYWPSTLEDNEEDLPAAAKPDTPVGEELVLLVEDDRAVRRFAARALQELGYSVHEADSGGAALDLVSEKGLQVQLLVTDLVMPGMNGTELASKITEMFPSTRVLFTSGYTEDAIVSSGAVAEGVNFLAKPYALPDLARKVREALDGS